MNLGIGLLRELHVLSTVFWIGIAVTNIVFIVPTAGKLGPDGSKFMGHCSGGPPHRSDQRGDLNRGP